MQSPFLFFPKAGDINSLNSLVFYLYFMRFSAVLITFETAKEYIVSRLQYR